MEFKSINLRFYILNYILQIDKNLYLQFHINFFVSTISYLQFNNDIFILTILWLQFYISQYQDQIDAIYLKSSTSGLMGKWLYDLYLKLMNNCVR